MSTTDHLWAREVLKAFRSIKSITISGDGLLAPVVHIGVGKAGYVPGLLPWDWDHSIADIRPWRKGRWRIP